MLKHVVEKGKGSDVQRLTIQEYSLEYLLTDFALLLYLPWAFSFPPRSVLYKVLVVMFHLVLYCLLF